MDRIAGNTQRPLFAGFYQMGFVARDLDLATEKFARRFGITRFRRKQAAPWLETAHAWIGALMVELIVVTPEAPALYQDAGPEDPAGARLHHHGFRVPDSAAWAQVCRQVELGGWDVPFKGSVMNGGLKYLYADTRADLGFYSEFVCLSGEACGIYDDVPRN